MVRLGAVSYLNVQPLVTGLDRTPGVSLRFDVPSTCARLLREGAIDLGMVPAITWVDRPGDRIVPGVCIGSDGAVASVALFTRRPIRDVRTIALDTSSRTSAALVRILCRQHFGIAPEFVQAAPDIHAMLAAADAALLIGDPALFLDYRALGLEKTDLGDAWLSMTGLPFVWAFWAGPADGIGLDTVALLQRAAARGTGDLDAVAAAYCRTMPDREETARRYLRENMVYDFSPRLAEGLRTYYREAADLGIVAAYRDPLFFG